MKGRRLLRKDNYFFWERDCPFCRKVWEALNVSQINAKLPPSSRVRPVEVKKIGHKHPAQKRFSNLIRGTPTVLLEGIPYHGATTAGYYKGAFEAHFKDKILPWLR